MDRLFLLIFGGVLYSIGAGVYATRSPDILPNLVFLPPYPLSPHPLPHPVSALPPPLHC